MQQLLQIQMPRASNQYGFYMRKYGRIGASYTDDLRCRLEALDAYIVEARECT